MREREIMRGEDLPLAGEHNIENAMAAAAVALALGSELETVGEALATFEGLSHRLQFVGEVDGVRFFNDSKATNPHAALRALSAFPGPTVVIMGGRNKGLSFDGLASELGERGNAGDIRAVYLIGEAAQELEDALVKVSARLETRIMSGLEEVFSDLPTIVERGDVVLFSPACASFDRYSDYKERGRHYQSLVDSYRERRGSGG